MRLSDHEHKERAERLVSGTFPTAVKKLAKGDMVWATDHYFRPQTESRYKRRMTVYFSDGHIIVLWLRSPKYAEDAKRMIGRLKEVVTIEIEKPYLISRKAKGDVIWRIHERWEREWIVSLF